MILVQTKNCSSDFASSKTHSCQTFGEYFSEMSNKIPFLRFICCMLNVDDVDEDVELTKQKPKKKLINQPHLYFKQFVCHLN